MRRMRSFLLPLMMLTRSQKRENSLLRQYLRQKIVEAEEEDEEELEGEEEEEEEEELEGEEEEEGEKEEELKSPPSNCLLRLP